MRDVVINFDLKHFILHISKTLTSTIFLVRYITHQYQLLLLRKYYFKHKYFHSHSRVDHPGMRPSILSKPGMGYRGNRDDLVWALGCTHGAYYVISGPILGTVVSYLWAQCIHITYLYSVLTIYACHQ